MNSQIIAHRGIWNKKSEGNTLKALVTALDLGYGIEFDVRDHNGKIIISHDPPQPSDRLLFLDELLSIYKRREYSTVLAINIKSDEIHGLLKKELEGYDISNYFLFDLSIPHLLKASATGLICLNRESEFEDINSQLKKLTVGRWIDYFSKEQMQNIDLQTNNYEYNVIVSPELHDFNCEETLDKIYTTLINNSNYWVCTDKPEQYLNHESNSL